MRKTSLFFFVFLLQLAQTNAQEVITIVDDDTTTETVELSELDKEADGKYIYINKKKYKKDKINSNYSYFYDENAKYSKKKYGLLKNNKKILPVIFKKSYYSSSADNKIILSLNGIYGLYNLSNNKWDISLKYNSLEFFNSMVKAQLNGKYGIIDTKDNIIVNFEWVSIENIYKVENYYKVRDKSNSDKYGVLSIFDKRLTIPCEYSSIKKDGTSNYFKVKKNKKYNLIDINNNALFKNWYDELELPTGGRKLYIVKLNGKMGIIDRNEKSVVSIEYINIDVNAYNDGSYLAQNKEGKFGCLSIDGRITMPFKYSNIEKIGYGSTNIIAQNNDKCGIVRINDGMPYEIATCNYDNIEGESKMFIVEKDNKFGMLDQYGNIVTEIIYDGIKSVSKSNSYYGSSSKLYIAVLAGKYYFMNNSGEKINKTPYKLIKPLYTLGSYNKYSADKSYIIVKGAKGKFGLVDIFGKEVIKQQFDDIINKKDNYVIVKIKKKLGVYDILKGKIIIPIEYDQFFLEKDNIIVRTGNSFFRVEISDTIKLYKL